MLQSELENLKYPIGHFSQPEIYSLALKSNWKETIKNFHSKLKNTVNDLTEEQLNTPYRPEGWTVRQVVHHCADSHMNAFIRFKLALTEEKPTIKPYEEQLWAVQADYQLPLASSLAIIEGLHYRWNILLESMNEEDYECKYIHPATGNVLDLNYMLGLYAWHCNHHLAHILNALKK